MELNIYIKNVGDGDTIIMDWQDIASTERRYGMIDCNLVDGRIDAVIQHFEILDIKQLEFLILSHPHYDHFSGLTLFFDYCKEKGIVIKRFCHTLCFDPSFIKGISKSLDFNNIITSSVYRSRHKTQLVHIFQALQEQLASDSPFIKNIYAISGQYELSLSADLKMRFLSPGMLEMDKYIASIYENSDKEMMRTSENNPDANLLSGFIQLYSEVNNWQILFCSDVTKYSLERIVKDRDLYGQLQQKKILAFQMPAHGSKHSHLPTFWDGLQISEAAAFISNGQSRYYSHPSIEVMKYFFQKCKHIHATNFSGGFKEYFLDKPTSNESLLAESMLNCLPDFKDTPLGNLINTSMYKIICGEKHFQLLETNNIITTTVYDVL